MLQFHYSTSIAKVNPKALPSGFTFCWCAREDLVKNIFIRRRFKNFSVTDIFLLKNSATPPQSPRLLPALRSSKYSLLTCLRDPSYSTGTPRSLSSPLLHYKIKNPQSEALGIKILVRERGLEPPCHCWRYHLKVVRLPISPPAHYLFQGSPIIEESH